MNGHPWTAADLATLREMRSRDVPLREIARALGRSEVAVKSRCSARRGAIPAGRPRRRLTPAEAGTIRAEYAAGVPVADLAARVGRTAQAVYRLAAMLGVRSPRWAPRWPAATVEAVREAHARGLNDAEIAAAVGVGRRQVAAIRGTRLGLPSNAAAVAAARRRAVRAQLRTLGLDSPTQLRTRAYARYARENGWPEDLRVREVQILNVLAVHGPQTMAELARRIGMRTDRIASNGRPALLAGNGPGGTYTASLIRRGLVVARRRHVEATRTFRGRTVRCAKQAARIYMLTAAAVAIYESHQQRQEERRGAAHQPA